jgi:hypothetical protein
LRIAPFPAADVVVIEIGVNDADASSPPNAQRIIAAQAARAARLADRHGPEPGAGGQRSDRRRWAAVEPAPCSTGTGWCPWTRSLERRIHPDAGQQGVLARSWILPAGVVDAVQGTGATACETVIAAPRSGERG